MNRLLPINSSNDIPEEYRATPIGLLLEYHNLDKNFDKYQRAKLLIGMCMDNRKHLHIPDNFAYIIRTAGANLFYSEFNVSYAISIGGVRHLALIGHNHCGMADLKSQKEEFVNGLSEATGWEKEKAEEFFLLFAPRFEIGDEINFILNETKRLRLHYTNINIAPMLYLVEDNKLYLIKEN